MGARIQQVILFLAINLFQSSGDWTDLVVHPVLPRSRYTSRDMVSQASALTEGVRRIKPLLTFGKF